MTTTQNLSPKQLDEIAASIQPSWAEFFADIELSEPAAPMQGAARAVQAVDAAPPPVPKRAPKSGHRPQRSQRRKAPAEQPAEPSVRLPTEGSAWPKLAMGFLAIVAVIAIVFWVRSGGQPVDETTQATTKATPPATAAPTEPAKRSVPEPKAEEPEDTKAEEPEDTKAEEPEGTKAEEPEDPDGLDDKPTPAPPPEPAVVAKPPTTPKSKAKPKPPPKVPPKSKPKTKPKSGNIVRDVPF